LILTPVTFLPMTFLALGGGGGAVTTLALRLPVCVVVEPALGPPDATPTKLALRARAERGIVEIGGPLSKLGMWDEKLSKACNEICSV
jgi:hypothetical protein